MATPLSPRETERTDSQVVERATPARGTDAQAVVDVVRELERELRAETRRRWLRRFGAIGTVMLVLGIVWGWQRFTRPTPPPRFSTQKVELRDVIEQVQSTGSVKPLKEVQVGAQVSGRVVAVHVDFNSVVKKGDLLAEIDPSLFGAQVSQAGAQLDAAKASVARAEARLSSVKTTLARVQKLNGEGLSSQAELDQSRGEHDVAQAEVGAARAQLAQLQAQLSSAKTTLEYTRIFSPIDGVVINRAVDPGQTVAASFSAPVLFVIAQDLKKMQVLAEIDEADVGKLTEGMGAEVLVDAFVGRKFNGKVSQVRYSPNNVQGVVTYSAVVDVENPELLLRPGMTATVAVKTREARKVLAVKNAALRFRPVLERDADGKPKPGEALAPLEHAQGRVYVPSGGAPGSETVAPRVVGIGITDGTWTELRGGLERGSEVVVEQREQDKKKGFRLF
jgi:HlyD family secretion protein